MLLLALIFGFEALSQTGVDLGLNNKKDFVSIETLNRADRNKIEDYFITDNDTLVNLRNEISKEELKLFCHYYTDDTLISNYKTAVFHYASNKDKKQKSYQWNCDIDVYVDSAIPKKIKKDFIKFYSSLNHINNLKINFVNDVEESNYIIKLSDTLISNYKMGRHKNPELHPLSKIAYNMLADDNKKFLGGIAKIDLDHLSDKSLLLQKLKQMFFISLGQFIVNETFHETSLLSPNYKNNETISNEDLDLLKIHYIKIYDKPLSAFTINELIEKSKSFCENE